MKALFFMLYLRGGRYYQSDRKRDGWTSWERNSEIARKYASEEDRNTDRQTEMATTNDDDTKKIRNVSFR